MARASPVPPGYRSIEGSFQQKAPGGRREGSLDPNERMSIIIMTRKRLGAPSLLTLDEWQRIPLRQRKYLTRDELATRYGASEDDVHRVIEFCKTNGLAVISANPATRLVTASGYVRQLEAAFAVNLGEYRAKYQAGSADSFYTYRGMEGYVYVPKYIEPYIEGVFGLDQRIVMYPIGGELATNPLMPDTVAAFYDFPNSPGNINTQIIALMEFGVGGFLQSDLAAFFAGSGVPTPVPVTVSAVPGSINAPQPSDYVFFIDDEITLDVDVAGFVAPGAVFNVYFSTSDTRGVVAALTTALMLSTPIPTIISISYGSAELNANGFNWTSAAITSVTGLLAAAASLGVTVLVASGDAGSDCNIGDGNAHVMYPASDPGVIAVGGTSIASDETKWAESTWPGSGGGFSEVFPPPSWQAGAYNGIGSQNADGFFGRGVPDIAGNADPHSGYNIILKEVVNARGGTSAAAPLYAGLVAILNATLGTNLGFLNPTLYDLNGATVNGQLVFHDIADGISNGKYTSVTYWDPCTGLGSVNGTSLLKALQAPVTSGIVQVGSFAFTPTPIAQIGSLKQAQQVAVTLSALDTQGNPIVNLPVTISFTSASGATLTTLSGVAIPAPSAWLNLNTDAVGKVVLTYSAGAPDYTCNDDLYAGTVNGISAFSDSYGYIAGQTPGTLSLEPNPFWQPDVSQYSPGYQTLLILTAFAPNQQAYPTVNMSLSGPNGAAANGSASVVDSNNNTIQLGQAPQEVANQYGGLGVTYTLGQKPATAGWIDTIMVTAPDGTSYSADGFLS